MNNQRLYTVKEGAAILHVGRSTMNRYCLKFGFKKFGDVYALTREDLDKIEDAIYREGKRLPKSVYVQG